MRLEREADPLVRVVDDDPEVRSALDFMLTCEGYRVKCYESAKRFLAEDVPSEPGCIIADIRMPEMSGIELFARLRERSYPVPLLFLTGHGDVDMAVDAMLGGAVDFIQKPIRNERLFLAIGRAIEKSKRRLGARALEEPDVEKARFEALTPREKDVVRLLAVGLMNKEVAERLGISPRTVEVYRATALRKLDVRTPADLAQIVAIVSEPQYPAA